MSVPRASLQKFSGNRASQAAQETGRCIVCRRSLCRFGERSSRPGRETRSRSVCSPSVDQYRERSRQRGHETCPCAVCRPSVDQHRERSSGPAQETGRCVVRRTELGPVWRAGLGARSRNSLSLGLQSERRPVPRAHPHPTTKGDAVNTASPLLCRAGYLVFGSSAAAISTSAVAWISASSSLSRPGANSSLRSGAMVIGKPSGITAVDNSVPSFEGDAPR